MRFRAAGLERFVDVHHGGQGLVINVHELRPVSRLRARLGDHHGDWLALVANLFFRDRVTRRVGQLDRRKHRRHRECSRAADDVLEVGGCIYSQHARRLLGRFDAQAFDASVSVRATNNGHVYQARSGEVICVPAVAGDQTRVFATVNLGADHLGNGHVYSPPVVAAAVVGCLALPFIAFAADWTDLTMFT